MIWVPSSPNEGGTFSDREVNQMPQTIRRGGGQQGSDWWQREVNPGVAVLAGVTLLVIILLLVNQFITPIFPQRRVTAEQAWQVKQQELQQRLPQGGWVSPAPGMPPVYVPPSAGQATPMAQGR
ncbi:MAG: hypothetical protein KatS3mg022_0662 [Armatimonadota bacterium]|nr:MAG: hypothetical protein KatS3mg022_0662 [Armatimonadota bacterium]